MIWEMSARGLYGHNINVIRSYPASVTEEVEIKVTRMLLTVAVMALVLFGMAFMRVPYPVLLAIFMLAAPTSCFLIWRRRDPVPED